jgi:hypothetical protein
VSNNSIPDEFTPPGLPSSCIFIWRRGREDKLRRESPRQRQKEEEKRGDRQRDRGVFSP